MFREELSEPCTVESGRATEVAHFKEEYTEEEAQSAQFVSFDLGLSRRYHLKPTVRLVSYGAGRAHEASSLCYMLRRPNLCLCSTKKYAQVSTF